MEFIVTMEYVYYIEVRDADTGRYCHNLGVAYVDLKIAQQACEDWNTHFATRKEPYIATLGALMLKHTPISF